MDQPHTLALVETNIDFMIVDDFTRYTWVFFLVDKSDVFAIFKTFIKRIHNEFETTIKKVRCDNRSEFKNTRVDDLCDEFGIRHQFLVKYTPQSNGLVKRKNIWQNRPK